MQTLFLRETFNNKKTTRFLPVVLDIVNYHHQYAAALLAPTADSDSNIPTPEDLCLVNVRIAPSALVAHFTYDIEESLAAPYILLLEKIRDGIDKSHLSETGLNNDEVHEFIVFALQEGILVNN